MAKPDNRFNMLKVIKLIIILLVTIRFADAQQKPEALIEQLLKLTPDSKWTQTAAIPLKFDAHHTQGMVKIGEYFFMTSVEVSQWPKRYEKPQNGLDRDTGAGKGHVFKFDAQCNLLVDLPIGSGDIYHPGGIDFDGTFIWIPVTEYRPKSFSVIYKLNPKTMELTEVVRIKESIGAIVHNLQNNTLTGANWGARKFYTWQLDKSGKVTNGNLPPEKLARENPSFYVDFQDCKYLGNGLMLGSGLSSYKNDAGTFRLGGWEIFSLNDFRPVRQVPIKLWSPTGAPMCNNPSTVELTANGLRAYFVPDDDEKAVLFVYEVSH